MTRELLIGAVRLIIDPQNACEGFDRGYAESIFPDGAVCPARPHNTDQYLRCAAECGCLTAFEYCWNHEYLHHAVVQAMGLQWSHALHAVAVGAPWLPEYDEEERIVGAFQRFVADPARRHDPALWRLHQWVDIGALRAEALRLFGDRNQ